MEKIKFIFNRRLLIIFFGVLFCAISIATSGYFGMGEDLRFPAQRARVLMAEEIVLWDDQYIEGMRVGRQLLEVELLTGNHAGTHVRMENIISRDFYHFAEVGMELLVYVHEAGGQIIRADVAGHSRHFALYAFVGLFFAVLIAVGRKKGLYSAISLLFTLAVLIFFMLPLIMRGHSPVLAAVITAATVMVFNILVVTDIGLKSLAAIVGTLFGVTTAGLLSMAVGRIVHISGFHIAHAEEIIFLSRGGIRVSELLFAGIIIGALGAIIDTGMGTASSVFEMKAISPKMNRLQLYKSGMNIGRDTMGTMSNTLILAFAGSSVSVMVVIALYRYPYLSLVNLNLLAVEVIQGLSASIGLILTVPVTSALSAYFAARQNVKTG
ncbi:MAG: YibE/F family protein [Defluviitaleaceae bacterium]|nr:YibE/F family protein [Defluviitaleaceae bacterium]MCL2262830.1 YibE/F family protein [Defluviitaleaceae bacterium]